jgi:hypothetical protein
VAVLALLCAGPARAQKAGDLGLGVILGDPIGATAKYMFNQRDAVQATLGVSEKLTFTADYVWHGWSLTPQPKRGPLALYLAGGVRLEDQDDFDFGIRTMLGVSYWPKLANREAEFFVELGPTYRLTNDFRVRVDGGFGVRMYFTPSGR